MEKLPLAEFEIMEIIWTEEPPVSTKAILGRLEGKKDWKPQTVLTLLTRLIQRGFIGSKRSGRERLYAPCVDRDDYLTYESAQFIERFHHNSVVSLLGALHQGEKLSSADIDELKEWLKEQR